VHSVALYLTTKKVDVITTLIISRTPDILQKNHTFDRPSVSIRAPPMSGVAKEKSEAADDERMAAMQRRLDEQDRQEDDERMAAMQRRLDEQERQLCEQENRLMLITNEQLQQRTQALLHRCTTLEQVAACVATMLDDARRNNLCLEPRSLLVVVNRSPVPMRLVSPQPCMTERGATFVVQRRGDDDAAPPPPYLELSDMNVRELKDELQQRGLPTTGRKASLLARLNNNTKLNVCDVCIIYALVFVNTTNNKRKSRAASLHCCKTTLLEVTPRATVVQPGLVARKACLPGVVDRALTDRIHVIDASPELDLSITTFENQRWSIWRRLWSSALLFTDRWRFSDASGSVNRPRESIALPPRELGPWQWTGEWRVAGSLEGDAVEGDAEVARLLAADGEHDADGFAYAIDFPFAYGHKTWCCFVRRRLWTRTMSRREGHVNNVPLQEPDVGYVAEGVDDFAL
jgi:hypothetical protein